MSQLIRVLKPLKDITLRVSQGSDSLCITNVIPLFYFCTEKLSQSMKGFKKEDDIYIGIEACLDKLNHYYDKVSPMVGIALILDPRMKKDFLSNAMDWSDDWIDTVDRHFTSAFRFYKSKLGGNTIISDSVSDSLPSYQTKDAV